MRKIAALMFAVFALAVAAQPAAADTTAYISSSSPSPGVQKAACSAAWQVGVPGQYGAWGAYIDGCTVALACPWSSYPCTVRGTPGSTPSSGG